MTDNQEMSAPFEMWVVNHHGQKIWPWMIDGDRQNRSVFTSPAGVRVDIPGAWSPILAPGAISVLVGAEQVSMNQGHFVVRDVSIAVDDLLWTWKDSSIVYPAYQGNIVEYPEIKIVGSLLTANVENTPQGIIAAWWDAAIQTERIYQEITKHLKLRADLYVDDHNVQHLILLALDRLKNDAEFQTEGP